MGNWNELTITPENGEVLNLAGGKSCAFSMSDYEQFVLGFIANQVQDKAKCFVEINDDYNSDSYTVEFEKEYKFTCIVTGKEYKINSASDVDFTDESFWDGFFHWDEDYLFPISGAFRVSSFHEDEDILWLLNGVPTKLWEFYGIETEKNSKTEDVISGVIKAYANVSENENIIRLTESGSTDLAFELLKGLYVL